VSQESFSVASVSCNGHARSTKTTWFDGVPIDIPQCSNYDHIVHCFRDALSSWRKQEVI